MCALLLHPVCTAKELHKEEAKKKKKKKKKRQLP
jgi:hypothetical protein